MLEKIVKFGVTRIWLDLKSNIYYKNYMKQYSSRCLIKNIFLLNLSIANNLIFN